MKAYYLFGNTSMPSVLNKELNQSIKVLSKIKDPEECLKAAYDLITSRFGSSRVKTVTRFYEIFSNGANNLWNRTGFLHCTNQNYLLTLLLVNSGHFKQVDIKPKWTQIWFASLHHYLQVKIGKKIIKVDPWGKSYGIPFGDYAHGFNSKLLRVN